MWLGNPDLWLSLGLTTVIALAAVYRIRRYRPDEYPQMNWLDWCGHFALVGIFTILISAVIGMRTLAMAGLFLLVPLYPIAVLGLLGKVDDMRVSFLRAWRKR